MQPPREPVFLRRVALKNYRSIAACDVQLGPLTFLVGPNGSGKSNFLDSLRFVSDALTTSLDHALRSRGGIHEVRRRSAGHPTNFGIRLEFDLAPDLAGSYAFEVAAKPRGEFAVKRERCDVGSSFYEVRQGLVVEKSMPVMPPAASDRLYLVHAAGLPEFRPLFDALRHMGFYNIDPAQIRGLQAPDQGDLLVRDGRNLASVAERLERAPAVKARIEAFLAQVVPGIVGFERQAVGHMETVVFRQQMEGAREPWRFPAINMSDGTLRALAILVALFQAEADHGVRFVGIEEPENALHPAAAAVVRDAIVAAGRRVQVVVTSHSAELLDDPRMQAEMLRGVAGEPGGTLISDLDWATRDTLRERLYTAGELLRLSQLRPDVHRRLKSTQLELFPRSKDGEGFPEEP